jgi:hypothetical protein
LKIKTNSDMKIARTIEEIRDEIRRIRQRPLSRLTRDDETFMNGLIWAAGGCVNAYHPPECGKCTPMLTCRDLGEQG